MRILVLGDQTIVEVTPFASVAHAAAGIPALETDFRSCAVF